MGKFKCQALVLLVPANFQAPRPARVTLFPALSGSRIFCSCPAGVWLERQARVRLLSGWTFSYGTDQDWDFLGILGISDTNEIS